MDVSPSRRFPLDVWVGVLEHLDPRCIGGTVALVDRSLASACRSPALWNRLALRRAWRIDPEPLVVAARPSSGDGGGGGVDWKAAYRAAAAAEDAAMARLRGLASATMESTLGRHFVGRPPHPVYSGWEDRFWSFERRTILAWDGPGKRNCYAEFPIGRHCAVKVLTEEDFGVLADVPFNPVEEPRPHCFTVSGTSLDVVWSCPDAEVLREWVDKLNVTIHAQRSEDGTFLLNPKYRLATAAARRGAGREEAAVVPGPADIVSSDVA